jgi:hypothetical protein
VNDDNCKPLGNHIARSVSMINVTCNLITQIISFPKFTKLKVFSNPGAYSGYRVMICVCFRIILVARFEKIVELW